jgi:hypothetical protein
MNNTTTCDVFEPESDEFSDFSEESKENFKRFLEDLGKDKDRSCGTSLSHTNSSHSNHSNW